MIRTATAIACLPVCRRSPGYFFGDARRARAAELAATADMTRYYGWYANRPRGTRRKATAGGEHASIEVVGRDVRRGD